MPLPPTGTPAKSAVNFALSEGGIPNAPEVILGSLRPFAHFVYVRHAMRAQQVEQLPRGCGPSGAITHALSFEHPYSKPPGLDPLLDRCRTATARLHSSIAHVRLRRLHIWTRVAEVCAAERHVWLASFPTHAAKLYKRSGLHGPLLQRIHAYLVSLGYPDEAFLTDISVSFRTGGRDSWTGLWPARGSQGDADVDAGSLVAEAFRRVP